MARADRTDEAATLDIVERFETYEDYLDSQLTTTDMNYLGDEEMARQLVELNYTGLGNCMKREVCSSVSLFSALDLFKTIFVRLGF